MDEKLVAAIDAAAEYEQSTELAHERLRQAFFKLSVARHHVPTDTLSSLSYPEFFQADAGVVGNQSYSICKFSAVEESIENETTLRQRKKVIEPKVNEAPSSLPTSIIWFAPLPPHELRSAQQEFAKALKLLVQTATCAADVKRAIDEVKQARMKK
ncbi:hypothetical protein THRCLA_08739 [Thraustotheca clavata]|uniref:Vacuolar ATPase assembly protein VMA22 n=1 Tax=Thraustotheca clavata TaxID=74557 RepID=A0A1V9Z2W4_9STRA|nr:hypothetical protein THRCLA_08739 [Thraustotheca clavata]